MRSGLPDCSQRRIAALVLLHFLTGGAASAGAALSYAPGNAPTPFPAFAPVHSSGPAHGQALTAWPTTSLAGFGHRSNNDNNNSGSNTRTTSSGRSTALATGLSSWSSNNANGSGLVSLQTALSPGLSGLTNLVQFTPNFLKAVPTVPGQQKFDLDLGSTQDTVQGSSIAGLSNLTITVGGKQDAINGFSLLTPAEAAAVYQLLSGGNQTLLLDKSGSADGGSLKLSAALLSQLSGLSIPKGVTVADNFAGQQQINLSGALNNGGTLTFAGGKSGGVELDAASILNNPGASITSSAALTLATAGTLNNAGTLNAGGSLTLYAGADQGSQGLLSANAAALTNSGNISAQHGALNLVANKILNSGAIKAPDGSIDVLNSSGKSLAVNNTGGQFVAANQVNFGIGTYRSPASGLGSNNSSITLTGGSFVGNSVNLIDRGGNIAVNAGAIDGMVNATGYNAAISVQNGNLTINQVDVSGDPLFTSTGNLQLHTSSFDTNGADFIALAGGNITTSGKGTINTSSSSGAGGIIDIEAGVLFSGQSSTGKSVTGGSINLTGVNLDTSGSDVTLVANAGKTVGSGAITVGNITTSGNLVHGNAGNVTVTSANTTVIGNITAAGFDNTNTVEPGGLGGNVTITVSTISPLTVGTIDTHGGAGGSALATGISGDGGDGGDGGGGFSDTTHNPNITTGGGQGGNGGYSIGSTIPGFINPGAGGTGGASDTAGQPGTQGTPNAGAGGKGGNGGTTLGNAITGQTGSDGSDGNDGAKGGNGGDGQNGGDAGSVTISTKGNLIVGSIIAYGGIGGNGTIAGNGGWGGGGGYGGRGGGGMDGPTTNTGATDGVTGGNGGTSGNGGAGGGGGDGGDGGKGGDGGGGGAITLNVGGTIVINNPIGSSSAYQLNATGGNGGTGNSAGAGGNGGDGGGSNVAGAGGTGGVGGSMFTQTGTDPGNGNPVGTLVPNNPGAGGNSGNGGTGGAGGDGGGGGTGGDGGKGGQGGNITISSSGTVSCFTVYANGHSVSAPLLASVLGGNGGGGGVGGSAGFGGSGGGGGAPPNPGGTGQAGSSWTNNAPPNAEYAQPANPANAANGTAGNGGDGGKGGDGGDAGDGGKGGDAGVSGLFSLAGKANITTVDGTTLTSSKYAPFHINVAGAGSGGIPGQFTNPPGYGGMGGFNPVTNVQADNGDDGHAGNKGATGNATTPTTATIKGPTPPPPPPPPPKVFSPPLKPPGGGSFGPPPFKGSAPPPPSGWAGSVARSGFLTLDLPFSGRKYVGDFAGDLNAADLSRQFTTDNAAGGGAQQEQVALSNLNNVFAPVPAFSLTFASITNTLSPSSGAISISSSLEDNDLGVTLTAGVKQRPAEEITGSLRLGILSAVVGAPLSASGEVPAPADTSRANNAANRQRVALLCPDRPTELATAFGCVHIAAGAVVVLIGDETALSIYDLLDDKHKSVWVDLSTEKLSLSPGKHLMLARPEVTDFASVNKMPYMGYRCAEERRVNESVKAFFHDFEMAAMLVGFAPVRDLVNSNSPQQRKLTQRILKTTAIVWQLSANNPYELMMPPSLAVSAVVR